MKKGDAFGSWQRPTWKKTHKRYKDFANKSWWKVKFQEGDEVWLNIKNFWLLECLSHKFLGPYMGPFKVLEKKFSNTYKLELSKNLRVHPTFHVSLLKSVTRNASRPNWEHNSRPPPDLVHNKPEFEVEAVFKLKQLRGWEREYLVKWKGYHPIEASWVNESDMEHAQEAIEEFHTRSANKRHKTWWGHHLSFSGVGCHIKCTTSSYKWNKGLRTSKILYHENNV
jgi:hypothetical protein